MNRQADISLAQDSRWHYGRPAIVLHWLLALLIACQIGLGLYMMAVMDDEGSERYFNLHMSIGIVIAALVLLRIGWRLGHRPADLPGTMPGWEVRTTRIVQWLLYACMLALPVTGFLGASLGTDPVVFFGLPLPRWIASDKNLSEQFFDVHVAIVALLVTLVGLHVLGALKHLLIDRDGVFQRMWF